MLTTTLTLATSHQISRTMVIKYMLPVGLCANDARVLPFFQYAPHCITTGDSRYLFSHMPMRGVNLIQLTVNDYRIPTNFTAISQLLSRVVILGNAAKLLTPANYLRLPNGYNLNSKFLQSNASSWGLFFSLPQLLICSNRLHSGCVNAVVPTNIRPVTHFTTSRLFASHLQRKSPRFFLHEDAIISAVLVRFIENLAKSQVSFILNRSPELGFSGLELTYLTLLNTRMWRLFKTQAALRFWEHFGICAFLMFQSNDPQYLVSWLHNQLTRMSSFSHKRFLSFLTYLLRIVYVEMGDYISAVGCRIDVVGKISVSGNARSRSIIFKQGRTSFSDMGIKSTNSFYLVRTHTGCLGLTVWFFYV